MCFSASASFAAAGVLSFIGLLSFKKVTNKSQYLFAGIPMLFAIQQASEGVVWLTLDNPAGLLHRLCTYGFLFFAYVVWPSYIPTALASLEMNLQRKKLMNITCAIGSAVSAWLLVSMLTGGASVSVTNCHLAYYVDLLFANSYYLISVSYVIAALTPFFISSVKYMWIMGIAVAISIVAAYHFYYLAFVSVWCFFAAIISALVYLIICRLRPAKG